MASTELKPIYTLKPVWDEEKPKKRLELARKRANDLRNELLESKPVVYFRSFDLVRVPYPTWYAFSGHSTSWSPFIHILNRMFVVQFYQKGKLKTMLVSPSDLQGNRATPFFKRLGDGIPFSSVLEPLIAPQYGTVESHLQSIGLRPEDIDYITYDHLHTQDLRKWLGDTVRNRPAFFPNAKLLVPKQEWESTLNLLPIQADWYCPGGISGIPEEKIITYDTDVIVGDGVALILTPGHTEGNQSIVVHSDEGLMVTSENGVGAECYVPHKSNIPGLAQYAQQTNMEVILNGNTLEHGLNQYVSMVIEKEIAGPSVRNPTFPNVVNSSELSWYWLFPEVTVKVNPSFSFGQLKFGKPVINEKYDVPY